MVRHFQRTFFTGHSTTWYGGPIPEYYLIDTVAATPEALAAPSSSSAIIIPKVAFCMFVATPETSSRRPRVEEVPGDDGIPAAPVNYFSVETPQAFHSATLNETTCGSIPDDVPPVRLSVDLTIIMRRFQTRHPGIPTISDPGRYDASAVHDDDDNDP